MLDGAAGKLKYDVTLTRGSGNEWRNDGDPYLLTARFSTDDESLVQPRFDGCCRASSGRAVG